MGPWAPLAPSQFRFGARILGHIHPGVILSVPMLGIQKIVMVYTNHPFAKYSLMLIREDPTLDEAKERAAAGLPGLPAPAAEDGDGAYRCMKAALKRAGMNPEDIDYVNAHGTSTPLGDEIELGAVKRVFGDAIKDISMSSTKSAVGHLLGAAGAVEAIYSILAMRNSVVPPTLNLDNPSDACQGVDLVPYQPKERKIRAALSNSFGFGGTNASLVFKAYD